MNYNKLFYFYEIAKSLNITKTAGRLFVSQSSLSKAVRDLEEFFGVELFARANRAIRLTPAGQALKAECDVIFSREADIVRNVRYAASHYKTQIKLGYMAYNAIYRLPGFLAEFHRERPEIQVERARYQERGEITAGLVSGALDVGLKIFTMDDIVPELSFRVLKEDHLSIIVPKDHRLAACREVSLSELKDENFVFFGRNESSSEYKFAKNWCQRSGFEPRVAEAYDLIETVLLMVQSGAGISILSGFAPIQHIDNVVNVPLANAPVIYSGLFWKKTAGGKALAAFINAFFRHEGLDELNELCGEMI